MKTDHTLSLLVAAFLACICSASAYQPITNYRSVIAVNDIAVSGDKVWMASSGGLYCYRPATRTGDLFTDTRDFPDLELTSLHLDSDGALWIGTRKGYLYKRLPSGVQTVLTGYTIDQWGITDIVPYQDLFIITSSKGCSIFDRRKMEAIKNASYFSTFSGSKVNTAAVFNDTLFLGCTEGVAKTSIAGNRLKSMELNFFDRAIWTVETREKPVISFLQTGDSLQALSTLSARHGSATYTASATTVYKDTVAVCSVDSSITCIVPDTGGCWIGTLGHYAYRWNGTDTAGVVIPGPTFNQVTAIRVARSGELWVLPPTIRNTAASNLWTMGISSYNGKTWSRYGSNNAPGIGVFNDGNSNRGVTEDRLGNMWFGNYGGNVKHFTRSDTSWQVYCVNTTGVPPQWVVPQNGELTVGACPTPGWAWCDAITTDSSGYVWLANYENFYGCLVCVDPAHTPDPNPRYRRYFPGPENDPLGSRYYMTNITMLATLTTGTILAGSDLGELMVMTHDGNPLSSDVTPRRWFSKDPPLLAIDRSAELGMIFAATSTSDGKAWIATAEGVFTLDAAFNLDSAEGLSMSCNGISVEDDTRLWVATMNQGVIRYEIGPKKVWRFNTENGLAGNKVNDVFVDKARGCVWAATSEGVSRIDLGYSPGQTTDGSTMVVYPNPFSLSLASNREISFRNAPSGSTISIYSTGGALVGTAAATPFTSVYGQTYTWRPRQGMVPGTYFYVTRSADYRNRGKLLIIP